MTGVDINLDTNIGKRLSTLSNTLTMLTGEEEEEGVQEEQLDDDLEDTENELPTIKVPPSCLITCFTQLNTFTLYTCLNGACS